MNRLLSGPLLALAVAAPAQAQQDSLATRLRDARMAMTATGSRLTGAGAEFLVREARLAQFTLIGEDHGVAEVPQLATLLLEQLVPAGYSHVAIETSPAVAAAMQRHFRSEDPEVHARFLREHHPAVAFFFWEQDAEFARAASRMLANVPDALWGLDYDVTGDRYPLRRLRELTSDPQARSAVDGVIATADSALAVALETKNPGALMMWGGPEDVWPMLRRALQPAADSEAARILHVLEETRRINGLFLAGRNYESNLRRADLNKAQFTRYYRTAERRGGRPPRVLFKFGASHAYRGLSQTNVFDLGTLASELAGMNGLNSFHVLVVAGPGTQVARLDPTVFRSVEAAASTIHSAWMKPFLDATHPERWTVFDLRPLRAENQSRRFGVLPDALNRLLYAFDAVVVLGGSTPQRDIVR